MINIEVAYASEDEQVIIPLQVAKQSTIEQAILESGILETFPEIDIHACDVGIFSQPALLSSHLQDGDRIEIYRPLLADPKQQRLKRAQDDQAPDDYDQ